MRYEIEVNGRLRQVTVDRADGRFVVAVDGKKCAVDAARVDGCTLSLLIEEPIQGEIRLKPDPTHVSDVGSGFSRNSGRSYEVTLTPEAGSDRLGVLVGATPVAVTVNGRRRRGRADDSGRATSAEGPQRIVAPMPGKIVRVLVRTGEAVQARQPVVVIEAMKMENELRAVGDGTMAEIHVRDGELVEAGALLAVIHR